MNQCMVYRHLHIKIASAMSVAYVDSQIMSEFTRLVIHVIEETSPNICHCQAISCGSDESVETT